MASVSRSFPTTLDPLIPQVRVEGTGGYAPILQGVDFSQITDGDDFTLAYLNSPYTYEFDKGYTLVTPVRHSIQVPTVGARA